MKTFIAYPVTSSISNIQVSRRYKHFDWLHERLSKKYGMVIPIPPLPDKQVVGRFEEDLVELRRIQLQSFTDRICRHPILSRSEVWNHFITETDDKKWTQGKRKVENDPNQGLSFITTIQSPSIKDETEKELDGTIVTFTKNMQKVETAVKNMKSVASDQVHRYRSIHSKESKEIGKAFTILGEALAQEAPCLKSIGKSYTDMSNMWERQASKDWEPLQNMMHDYKGITGAWHSILSLHGNMKEKQKEIMNADEWEKEKFSSVERLNKHRVAVETERAILKDEISADIIHVSQTFVVEQINFYRQMAEHLEKLYYECWPSTTAASENLEDIGTSNDASVSDNQGFASWD